MAGANTHRQGMGVGAPVRSHTFSYGLEFTREPDGYEFTLRRALPLCSRAYGRTQDYRVSECHFIWLQGASFDTTHVHVHVHLKRLF